MIFLLLYKHAYALSNVVFGVLNCNSNLIGKQNTAGALQWDIQENCILVTYQIIDFKISVDQHINYFSVVYSNSCAPNELFLQISYDVHVHRTRFTKQV